MDAKQNIVAKAIDKAGSQVALAEQLGVTQQAVSRWLNAGRFPVSRALQVHEVYGFALRKILNG